jgi:hypothetical protein
VAVLLRRPPDSFITLDQPLILCAPSLDGQRYYRPRLLRPEDVELTIALNRAVALHRCHDNRIMASWHDATTEEVRRVNLRTATNARDLYVASRPDFAGREEIMRRVEHQAAQSRQGGGAPAVGARGGRMEASPIRLQTAKVAHARRKRHRPHAGPPRAPATFAPGFSECPKAQRLEVRSTAGHRPVPSMRSWNA